jgi:hypothetical protein
MANTNEFAAGVGQATAADKVAPSTRKQQIESANPSRAEPSRR